MVSPEKRAAQARARPPRAEAGAGGTQAMKSILPNVCHKLVSIWCERMVYLHGALLLIVRRRSGFNPRQC